MDPTVCGLIFSNVNVLVERYSWQVSGMQPANGDVWYELFRSMNHVLVMWCAIFAAAGSQQAKICLRARSEAVIYVCENEVGRKNAKESEAAVTAADESMVSCQTECSCCLFEG